MKRSPLRPGKALASKTPLKRKKLTAEERQRRISEGLRLAWARRRVEKKKPKRRRKRLPGLVRDEALLASCRRVDVCPICKRRRRLFPCHLRGRGAGGGLRLDVEENVLAACHECHMSQHNGSKGAMYEAKAAELRITVPELRERLDRLTAQRQEPRCGCGRERRPGRPCCDWCFEYGKGD